jgi:hypothetical protein
MKLNTPEQILKRIIDRGNCQDISCNGGIRGKINTIKCPLFNNDCSTDDDVKKAKEMLEALEKLKYLEGLEDDY